MIREFQPDIIHTWQYSPNFWGRLAGRRLGYRRFVASELTLKLTQPWWWRYFEKMVCPQTIYQVNSKAVGENVIKGFGIRPENIRVVYNAVEAPNRDRQADRAEVRRNWASCPTSRSSSRSAA